MAPIILLVMVVIAAKSFAQISRPVSGVIAASTSPVEVRYTEDDGGNIGRLADTGDPIFLDDEIVTGPSTSAQILLKDQSVFSIGPSSAITIDRFVYDPDEPGSSSLLASISRGTFKFISGKIAQTGEGKMTLNLPNAVASIRGTSGAGRISDDGTTEIALLSGTISLDSGAAASPVDLLTSGWGVTISPSGGIGAPELLPGNVLDSIIADTEFTQNTGSVGSSPADAGTGSASANDGTPGGASSGGAGAENLAELTPAQLEERLDEVETLDEAVAVVAAVLGPAGGGTGPSARARWGGFFLKTSISSILPILIRPCWHRKKVSG